MEDLIQDYLDILNSLNCPLSETVVYKFNAVPGRKFTKIMMTSYVGGCASSTSIHAFVETATGYVYKPASYKTPAKGVRYTLEDMDTIRDRADALGAYLYR